MKCFKRICALALSFSLVLTSFAGFSKEEVKADDTVAVKYVSNEQQFRDYIDNNGAEELVTKDMAIYNLKKGTYYFRAYRWNGYGHALHVYTAAGFIPKSGKIKASGSTSKTVDEATPVKVATVSSVS